ncbi:MAG: S1 RNA-binding domain-containing protein [Eubacteriales bacterium]|jgi:small subunit ribosomal protein S1
MEEVRCRPEGWLLEQGRTPTRERVESAAGTEQVLEGRVLRCTGRHDLEVELEGIRGVIPREEAALGIDTGAVREIAILSRVGRPVSFQVLRVEGEGEQAVAILSRRRAQEACLEQLLSQLRPGDVLPARVTHLEPFGCFVDIGCGVISLISIENISVSRISHPRDRFTPGQDIRVVVRSVDGPGRRIYVSHKELLGTWLENAAAFSPGETVTGVVRSVEDYGVFVELAPNLAGLCEYRSDVRPGQWVSVFLKSILPQRMKVKMLIIGMLPSPPPPQPLHYHFTGEHMDSWEYSPPQCTTRSIRTDFTT